MKASWDWEKSGKVCYDLRYNYTADHKTPTRNLAVNIDPQDFERHYASLSDDALLEMNRDDLVEPAQVRLDQELARRGLSRSNTAEAGRDWGEDDAAVAVSNFTYPDEAAEARDALDAAAIPYYLTQGEDGSTNAEQPQRRGSGGLLLMVPSSFADRALAVLQEELGQEDDGPLPAAEDLAENDTQ